MVIETIVGGIIKALAWKVAEKTAEKTGEAIVENRTAILEKVRGLLIGDELTTLNLLEKYPENTDLQKEFTEVVTPRLKENPETAKEIETLLENSGISIQIGHSEVKAKDEGVAIGVVMGGTVHVEKK